MSHLDKETDKINREGVAVRDFVNSEGWSLIRKELTDKVVELQWIGNITGETPEERDLDVKTKQMVVDILISWVADVEGRAEQSENNKELINAARKDIYRVTP